jgi:polyhydroxyalkanoate synthesis regulator phasin
VAEPKDEAPGGGLADALRRYVDAMVGATEVSRERAEKIIGDLARRGEVRTRDMQKAARELAERSARNQRDLARLIQKEVKRQVEALGLATRDDVGDLRERVGSLEDGSPHAATKPTAKPSRKPSRKPPARRSRAATTKKTDS